MIFDAKMSSAGRLSFTGDLKKSCGWRGLPCLFAVGTTDAAAGTVHCVCLCLAALKKFARPSLPVYAVIVTNRPSLCGHQPHMSRGRAKANRSRVSMSRQPRILGGRRRDR